MPLTDNQIEARAFIDDYAEMKYGGGQLSYGTSSAGYDARLNTEFLIMNPAYNHLPLDPKAPNDMRWIRFEQSAPITVAPGQLLLGSTVEVFNMPDDLIAECRGKSSYARNGISVLVTPLEPGWVGRPTLEIVNLGNAPVLVYPLEGICQFVFYELSERPGRTYADKAGKYQGDAGVQLSKP